MIKVSLSPKFDQYYGKDDLERDLGSVNLSHLMPTDKGARRAFFRVVNDLEQELGISFKIIKETKRDIMWSVGSGRKGLGTYMVIYGEYGQKKLPTFSGSKSRSVNKARTMEDAKLFDEILEKLDEALTNPGINSYTFHLHSVDWLRQISSVIEPRPTGNGRQKTVGSHYYYLEDGFLIDLQNLSGIYEKFNMTVKIERVES
jgi:hypothetical protein